MKKKTIFSRIKDFFIMLEYAISGGMKGANDEMMKQKTNSSDGHEINKHVDGAGGVFEDMLEERETQEVKELRDAYYRILNEADKYSVELFGLDDEVSKDISGVATKVSSSYFDKNINVYNPNGFKIRVIQDNKVIQTKSNFDPSDFSSSPSLYDYDVTLTIKRDFIPKFYIEKFANKVVVLKHNDDERFDIHIYTTEYASQFGKLDAILISELMKMKEKKDYKSNITDFETISFISDKAYGSDDLCSFEYKDIKYKGIETYDGNFVLIFDAVVVKDGTSITDKYVTKELTEKYEKVAPKKSAVDVFAIGRRIDQEKEEVDLSDFDNKTIKIKK